MVDNDIDLPDDRDRPRTETAVGSPRWIEQVLAAVGEAIITIDEAQTISSFNRQAERLFGYAADDVIGRPLDILLPRDAVAVHRSQVRSFAQSSSTRRLMGGRPEIRGRRKDGSEFIGEAAISKLEVNGETIFTAVLRDVSELRRAEAALRASEQRFRDIAEVSGALLWETDAQYRIVYAGGRTRTASGFAPVVGKVPWEFVGSGPDRQAVSARIRETLERHQPFQGLAYTAVGRDRKTHQLVAAGLPIFDEHGVFQGYRGSSLDVTDEVEAREAIDRQTALLNATFETISEGLIVVDRDLRIVAFNSQLGELLALAPGAIAIGDPAENFIRLCLSLSAQTAMDVDRLVDEELSSFRRAEATTFQRAYRHGNVIEIRHRPMPTGGFVRTYIDITPLEQQKDDLRSALAQAETANRAKTEFLANMSHELRTPLNAIIGFSELMRAERFGPLGSARYRDYAKDIQESGAHLLEIIGDILDLSKAESGRDHLDEDEVDLDAVIEASIATIATQASQGDVAVSVETPAEVPHVRADETKLKQILINLLSNAVKFTPPGGRVTVRAAPDRDGAMVIAVEDTGIGMAPDQIPVALEPFRQLGSHMSKKYHGTGLGLPLTKRLVELHAGSLRIDSAPGRGTCVTVTLPAERTVAPERR